MKLRITTLALLLGVSLVLAAQAQRPEIKRTGEVIQVRVDFAPERRSGTHSHPGGSPMSSKACSSTASRASRR
jgi:hypothetical protein